MTDPSHDSRTPANAPSAPASPEGAPTPAARLAAEHDAQTLAAALRTRLVADGRGDLAGRVAVALEGELGPVAPLDLDPTPPHPHRPVSGPGERVT
jgi:hypothetical protein